jgi:hypothetical protein
MLARALAVAILAVVVAAAPAGAAKTKLPGFHSPTGNIKCYWEPGPPSIVRCQIARADYAKTLTAHCAAPPIGVDWGGFELSATRKAAVTCTGGVLYSPETQQPMFVDLPYGKTWRHGVFACDSRTTGVTCRSRTGHGLFLSRESWRAW